MKKLVINGGIKLNGEIAISGAKNAALPILVSSLLLDGELTVSNVPNVSDLSLLINLLSHLGAKVTMDCDLSNKKDSGKILIINSSELNNETAPYDIVSKMRASFLVIGPLLARLGQAKVSLPGGCAIGSRPVDIHLEALKEMGAEIIVDKGYVNATAKNGRLKGANIYFRFPSVGATQNLMMAACLAEGTTVLNNCAKEPETVDLGNCLIQMGAKIKGVGTSRIEIEGVKKLNSIKYNIMGDRIEAFTYMCAALMTNGELILKNLDFDATLSNPMEKLGAIGADITRIDNKSIKIRRGLERLSPINIVTEVFPGFPTDMQATVMALLAMIDGESSIDETIFENRFMHVPELNRMGANIVIQGNKAIIKGKKDCYSASETMATDLRAGAALVLAGLSAPSGETIIHKIYHVERGYENFADKLRACGAELELMKDEEKLIE